MTGARRGHQGVVATPPAERDQALMRTGSRMLLLGLLLAVIGMAIAIPLSGTAAGIGVTLAVIACLPTAVGLGLCGSALVARRSRAGRPFA